MNYKIEQYKRNYPTFVRPCQKVDPPKKTNDVNLFEKVGHSPDRLAGSDKCRKLERR